MTTKADWLNAAFTLAHKQKLAGLMPCTIAGEALKSLCQSWEESLEEGISPTILVHDLKEVAHNLIELHDELEAKLPNVLEEMAEILP